MPSSTEPFDLVVADAVLRGVVVTGAAGKTGLAVTRACASAGLAVTAVIRREAQRVTVQAAGAARAVVVDLADRAALTSVLAGVDAVYHVPPNMHQDETGLTRNVIEAATDGHVGRFVLHSVLAPYLPEMPHHLRKAQSERLLRMSTLDWTILQPASYAQNVLPYLDTIRRTGRWVLPYRPSAPFTPVDLRDVARVAADVLGERGHSFASYELCGPQRLDSAAMALGIARVLGHAVELVHVAAERDVDADLRAMFAYYDRCGLVGNPSVLALLLGHAPTTFEAAIARDVTEPAPIAPSNR